MKVINETEGQVELSKSEATTAANLDFTTAVFHTPFEEALDEVLSDHKGKPSKAFIEWVSKGTRTVSKGEVVKVD